MMEELKVDANLDNLLKNHVNSILDLEEQIDDLKSDQKEYYSALKEAGLDTTVVRKMVTRMKKERQSVLDADEKLYEMEKAMGLKLPNW